MKRLRKFLRKVAVSQFVTLVLSVTAVILAVMSFNAVNVIESNNYLNNKKVTKNTLNSATNKNKVSLKKKDKKDTPDVEIIKTDGNVVKINVSDNADKDGNNSIQMKQNDKSEKKSNNTLTISDKNNFDLNEKNVQTNNVKSNSDVEKNNQKTAKHVVSASMKPELHDIKKNDNTKLGNTSNDGNFLVQIGAFQEISSAKQQCQKASLVIKNKSCSVVTVNNSLFRSIISGFKTKEEAMKASDKLSFALKINCFVKENI